MNIKQHDSKLKFNKQTARIKRSSFKIAYLVSNGFYCLLHSRLDLMLGFNSLTLDDDEMKKKLALEQEDYEIRRKNQEERVRALDMILERMRRV